MVEGDEAQRALAEASRRTEARRDLARHERFEQVSPEVGELDEDAFEQFMDDDLEASLYAVVSARSSHRPLHRDDLSVRAWSKPTTAVCLVVDRSGSMTGERLAAAAVGAASVLYRHGADCSVVAFSDRALVLKGQDQPRTADDVIGDLLRLRGHGVTDLSLALRTARSQLDVSNAGRKIVLLLSDCRVTSGGTALDAAAALEHLAIIAPAGDTADASALAEAVGATCVPLAGPSGVPDAIAAALGDA